jgi:hypothetical protein
MADLQYAFFRHPPSIICHPSKMAYSYNLSDSSFTPVFPSLMPGSILLLNSSLII